MIRPYLAVIKDSFREALSSRILLVVLCLITLFLIAVAPLTFVERKTTTFRAENVPDWMLLADQLRLEPNRQQNAVAEHLWELMSEDQRDAFASFKPLKERPELRDVREFERAQRKMAHVIDDLLQRPNFYDRKVWQGIPISLEARMLRNDDELDEDGQQRRNLVMLEDAFPGIIERSSNTSLQFYYTWFRFFDPLPVRKQQFVRAVEQTLPWLIDKGLLSIGLFVALLVTAPVIPQMFDPGSLHLLLSKPVSRSLLFLSKFVGSCAFVLICAIYLFVGIWIILGTRLGMWEHRLLWCIPLYTFVFMIYYSVAAFTALWWRNAILSVVIAGLFWGVCFSIGMSKQSMEGPMDNSKIVRLTLAEGSLIGVTGLHMPLEWDAATKDWKKVCVSEEQEQFSFLFSILPNLPPPTGPIYDSQHKQLVRVGFSFRDGRPALVSGKKSEGWKYTEGATTLPPPVIITVLNEPDGSVLMVTTLGLFRLGGDLRKVKEPPKIFGFSLPISAGGPLKQLDLEPAQNWNNPAAAAIDKDGVLAIYSRGTVTLLKRENVRVYQQIAQRKVVDTAGDPPKAVIAIAGGTVLVATEDGNIRLLDAKTLEEKRSDQPAGSESPRGAYNSVDGRWFAVVFHTGKLWLYDQQQDRWQLGPYGDQGEINTALFTPQGTILVGHHVTSVTEYEIESGKVLKDYSPASSFFELIYNYGVVPIYTVCPKPGEFYKTVQYLLTDQKTTANEDDQESLEAVQRSFDPWAPVWSSALFVAVVLTLSCLYIEWQEF